MNNSFDLVKNYILELDLDIRHENRERGILVIHKEQEGIVNLVVCVAPPMVIFEQYIFQIGSLPVAGIYKALLQKNRDVIHGAFALDDSGSKVIFRNTLQVENLDKNEFEATLNSLSLLLSEYAEQIIEYSKK